jgi:hypothetical protein
MPDTMPYLQCFVRNRVCAPKTNGQPYARDRLYPDILLQPLLHLHINNVSYTLPPFVPLPFVRVLLVAGLLARTH